MKPLLALIKKEYLEYRNAFTFMPLLVGSLFILASLIYLIHVATHLPNYSANMLGHGLTQMTPKDFYGASFPFIMIMWLIVFYYFLGSLYDDRKNGNVLFWLSMPISTTETMVSKLVTGLLIAPFISWLCFIVTQIVLLMIATLIFSLVNVPNIAGLWQIGKLFETWLYVLATIYIQALWLFPLLMWCMLCSAAAKKAPFIYAFVTYIIVLMVEFLLDRQHYLFHFIVDRIHYMSATWDHWYIVLGFALRHQPLPPQVASNNIGTNTLFVTDMWVGLAVGVVCILLAAWIRHQCYDFDRS